MKERIDIYEVGLRDGLQNERRVVATADKVALMAGLAGAGLRRIEVTSVVSAKAIPPMFDAPEMVGAASGYAELRASALVLNERGYDRAREAGATGIAMVLVLTEELARKNSRTM